MVFEVSDAARPGEASWPTYRAQHGNMQPRAEREARQPEQELREEWLVAVRRPHLLFIFPDSFCDFG